MKFKDEFVKEAKERMQRMALLQEGDNGYFLNGKKISLQKVAKMREIVTEMNKEEQMPNPVERLIDRKEFDNLPEEDKMRYVLELCNVYIRLKKTATS